MKPPPSPLPPAAPLFGRWQVFHLFRCALDSVIMKFSDSVLYVGFGLSAGEEEEERLIWTSTRRNCYRVVCMATINFAQLDVLSTPPLETYWLLYSIPGFIQMQLKYGEVEIGPPGRNRTSKDGATNVVPRVYNDFAHKVEIEYQPASSQEDTQWRFVCDGRVLKMVVPYRFWKTYLYPKEEDCPLRPEGVDPKPESSNPSAAGCPPETTVLEPNAYLMAELKQCFQAPPGSPLQHVSRPVLQSNQPAHSHQCTVNYTSPTSFGEQKLLEAAKKYKFNFANTISPMSREVSEKEFKVQYTCPAPPWNLANDVSAYSPTETYEKIIKVKCYRPESPEDLSGGRLKELSGNMPCSATEEFLKAKFGLQSDRTGSFDKKRYTGPQPLGKCYARETVGGAAASLCSETEGINSRQLARKPSRARATIDTATSPMPTPRKIAGSLRCIRHSNVKDIHTRPLDNRSLLGYGQQYNNLLLKDKHEVGPMNLWRRKCERISTETVILFKQGKNCGDVLKRVLEFTAQEKQILLKRGLKYLDAKKREWYRPRIQFISCACIEHKVVR